MSKVLIVFALAAFLPASAEARGFAAGPATAGSGATAHSSDSRTLELAQDATTETPAQNLDSPLPRIIRDPTTLPAPVQETRRQLMEAANSGDLEELRVLMQAQPEMPAVSFGDPGDPIDYLKALSSDAEGREILAILLEVLESGFVQVEPATEEELFVWPYFAQYPLEALTPTQLVELFTLLTAADYEDMKSYGAYTFFRVGIAPDGRWLFFLAGD